MAGVGTGRDDFAGESMQKSSRVGAQFCQGVRIVVSCMQLFGVTLCCKREYRLASGRFFFFVLE